jgi:uncharacterized protein YdiU (UPF0061 family)
MTQLLSQSYLTLPSILYSKTTPKKSKAPYVLKFNDSLATELGLFSLLNKEEWINVFSGHSEYKDFTPIAQAYAGHQFGHFSILGDGRALLLGEHLSPSGLRYDINLKGIGKTAYSRQGDGLATIEPMLREYLISQSMTSLGIPSSKGLAVIGTGEEVYRNEVLPGATFVRLLSSHIRFGTFQFACKEDTPEVLKALFDYTLERHFPNLINHENSIVIFLERIINAQIALVVEWMRVGFVHGVLNTDNMLICSETIDYGPCAFIDHYDPQACFSSIDQNKRYAYSNQINSVLWNCARLAETLIPLFNTPQDETILILENCFKHAKKNYDDKYLSMMSLKLGLINNDLDDLTLINELLLWMEVHTIDYTQLFTHLTYLDEHALLPIYHDNDFNIWHKKWTRRKYLGFDLNLMKKNNPVVIPRNHQVKHALHLASLGDMSAFNNLLNILNTPYHYHPSSEPYRTPPTKTEFVQNTYCGT